MEKVYPGQLPIIDYSGILVAYRFRADEVCRHAMTDHSLVYVFSGKLKIATQRTTCELCQGECAFLERSYKLEMTAESDGGKEFSGVFLVLPRSFFVHYHQHLNKHLLPPASARRMPSVSKLAHDLHIDSLFRSFSVFFNTGQQPTLQYLKLKQVEATDSLIGADNRFCVTLFDFLGEWKTDILNFMESSYKEDLSLSEMALYTGRSLATFKRDFSKVSKESPARWVSKRRLKEACRLIADKGLKPNDIYLSLGFKSLSHFSTAFKRQYGKAPSELLNKAD